MSTSALRTAPLLVPHPLVDGLLSLYDVHDPRRKGRIIPGYDCKHALRTSKMCAAVALTLGHDEERVHQYQIACILHDLGRAGLDQKLFGEIWSWARRKGIPTRPREWRAVYPETKYGAETEAFLERFAPELEAEGIVMDEFARGQVEMRLGYARRLDRMLRTVNPRLKELGVHWSPWMETVMLYYYYPELLTDAEPWIHQLGEILVACEQFEAYNNRQRGQDYYTRTKETLHEAFAYLEKLKQEAILSKAVVAALRSLAADGVFDDVLAEARGEALSPNERQILRSQVAVPSWQ